MTTNLEATGTASGGKAGLRARALTARRELPGPERARQAAAATAAVLEAFAPGGLRRAAAYRSFGTEPATSALRSALRDAGVHVLLPRVLPDRDLDWVADGGPAASLGPHAIARADLVVVPGLAGDSAGHRLGRGGGSYDRALSRVPAGVPRVLLLYAGELLACVPTEPHDQPVTHLALPTGVLVVRAGRP